MCVCVPFNGHMDVYGIMKTCLNYPVDETNMVNEKAGSLFLHSACEILVGCRCQEEVMIYEVVDRMPEGLGPALGEAGRTAAPPGSFEKKMCGIENTAVELRKPKQLILPKYLYCFAEVPSFRGL